MKEVKYRTANEEYTTIGENHTGIRLVRRLNKQTNQLIETGEVENFQDIVDSCKDNVLDNVLERLLPDQDGRTEEHNRYDDLDLLIKSAELKSKYEDKFGLHDKSMSEVIEFLSNDENFKESYKQSEVKENEAEDVEKGEQETVQENGEKDKE